MILQQRDITVYLAEKCKLYLQASELPHLISANSKTAGNIVSPNEHNHEEADTLIFWHCLHAAAAVSNHKEHVIVVYSSDTDVACGLVHFKDQIPTHLYMQTQLRYLDISSMAVSLSSKAKALISIHALSGCDTTGCFGSGRNRKGKKKWMHVFQDCDNEMMIALESLQSETPLKHIATFEKLLSKLYFPGIPYLSTLSDARWYMYTRNTAQCEKLPPTSGAFRQVVLRAACQARTWALSNESYRTLPDPELYGWEIVEGSYCPITSEESIDFEFDYVWMQ